MIFNMIENILNIRCPMCNKIIMEPRFFLNARTKSQTKEQKIENKRIMIQKQEKLKEIKFIILSKKETIKLNSIKK